MADPVKGADGAYRDKQVKVKFTDGSEKVMSESDYNKLWNNQRKRGIITSADYIQNTHFENGRRRALERLGNGNNNPAKGYLDGQFVKSIGHNDIYKDGKGFYIKGSDGQEVARGTTIEEIEKVARGDSR